MTTRVTITADAAHTGKRIEVGYIDRRGTGPAHSATLKILADGESCDTHVFDGRTITIKEVD